jgi:AAA15 family ATPase/GTPase
LIHIEELVIHKYRNLHNLKLQQLGQFNLLVGSNNSGKTSVLEAIELYCHPLDIRQFISTSRGRDRIFGPARTPLLDSIIWMFPATKNSKAENNKRENIYVSGIHNGRIFKISAACVEMTVIEPDNEQKDYYYSANEEELVNDSSVDGGRAYKVILEFQNSDNNLKNEKRKREYLLADYKPLFTRDNQDNIFKLYSTKFVTPVDHRILPISARLISKTIESGDKPNIIKLVKLFDHNIKGIEILSTDHPRPYPVPYFNHKKLGFAPVSVFGDGLRRALTLASALLQCRNGVLLIDELETAVHVEALEHVFTWLINACIQYNIQLFATTHSLETIDAVIAAGEKKNLLERFITYRLENKENISTAKRFSGKALHELRNELGQDVR